MYRDLKLGMIIPETYNTDKIQFTNRVIAHQILQNIIMKTSKIFIQIPVNS